MPLGRRGQRFEPPFLGCRCSVDSCSLLLSFAGRWRHQLEAVLMSLHTSSRRLVRLITKASVSTEGMDCRLLFG